MPPSVTLVSHAPASVFVMPWWRGEHRQLTIVAKAVLAIAPSGAATFAPPVPIVAKDQHHDRSPARSVEVPADLAPFKPRADVMLVGHAHAPAGRSVQAASVRLAVYGPQGGSGPALLDRTLHVVGDRTLKNPYSPEPFSKMPLVWERAVGGPGSDNPVGRPLAGTALPNLLDPVHNEHPACFAPLSVYWPSVRNRVAADRRRDVDAAEPKLPEAFEAFDWEYYQRAPEALRVPHLRGDEWIVLDGMHPTAARLAFRLPGARAVGVLHGAGGRKVTLSFALDTLLIDADRLLVTEVFRAIVAAEGAFSEDKIQLFAGIEVPPGKVAFPEAAPLSGPAPASASGPGARAAAPPPPRPAEDLGATRIAGDVLASEALPLAQAAAGAPATPSPSADLGPTRFADDAPQPPSSLPFRPTAAGPRSARLAAPVPSSKVAPPSLPFSAASPPTESTPFVERRPSLPFVSAPPSSSAPGSAAIPPTESTPFVAAQAPSTPFVAAPPAPPPVVPPPAAAPPASPAAASPRPWDADDDGEGSTLVAGAVPDWGSAPVLPFDPSAAVHLPPSEPQAPPAPPGDDDDERELTIVGKVGDIADLPFLQAKAPEKPAPPARKKDEPAAEARVRAANAPMIPLFAEGPLAVATLAWQVKPPQDSLTIIVKGTFDLVPGEPARPSGEPEIPTGDIPTSDSPTASLLYASDFAILKPMADVLLTGHAYPPRSGGGRGTAAQVSFRFGARGKGFERKVAVFGDRRWNKGVVTSATAPQPFSRMPLVYERAFGGSGFDANPSGVGLRAQEGEDGIARMPNLEDPDRLISSPTAQPEPVCFAPLPATWKERWSKLGTYDARWFALRWPYFPEDFDWTHFQVAPRPQRLPHLTGDEPYSIAGADPEHAVLEGKLPCVRARAFVVRRGAKELTEVRLALDTAAFDMDARRLRLVWRGMIDVSDPEAPELEAVYAFTEPLAGPRAERQEVLSKYLALTAPEEVPDLPPEKPANDPPEPVEPDPEVEAMIAEIEAREKAILEALAAQGIPTDAAPSPPRKASPETLEAALRAAGAAEEDVAALRSAFAPDAPLPPEPVPHRDPRKVVLEKLAAGEPLDREGLRGADLRGISFEGASLAFADLREADLRGCNFNRARLSGARLSGAQLDDATLEGADLRVADLASASLARAVLRGALVDEASFLAAQAEGAVLAGAKGALCRMTEAVLSGASFVGAELPALDLTKARIDGASFEGAKLADVKLYEVKGSRADFRKAEMSGARAEGASLDGAIFQDAVAARSVFESAILDGATFERARMPETSFARAKARKALFGKADLREGRFRRADARGASFVLANLTMATFERADLSLADMRGACLHEAETWHAKLEHAKLDQAIVTQTKLARKA